MMNEMKTVSYVSKNYGVSTRMLRYYEELGLIKSHRVEDYAYRMYSVEDMERLQQILLLRKLRIPLKQVKVILNQPEAVAAIQVFRSNIEQLAQEIAALTTIKSLLERFLTELEARTHTEVRSLLRSDETVLSVIRSLPVTTISVKEEKAMNNMQEADKRLGKLKNVRIVHVPPATVAASHYIGDEPELHARTQLDQFVRDVKLWEQKPDVRRFGFNHPNPSAESPVYGYEAWVTVPEDMVVPEPLEKKRFGGGLYAAYAVTLGDFDQWDNLLEWVSESGKYEFAGDLADQEHMCGLLDEHLNYVSHVQRTDSEPEDSQFDLLMPIREI